MADTVFRSAPAPAAEPSYEDIGEPNRLGSEEHLEDIEPVEPEAADEAVLEALGVEDTVRNLPDDEQANLSEVTQYVLDLLKGKGVTPTEGAIERSLEDLKFEMGLDPEAEVAVALDRIGGVIKAWKSLAFVTDIREKKALFSKLLRMPSSRDMNKFVFEAMENHTIWR